MAATGSGAVGPLTPLTLTVIYTRSVPVSAARFGGNFVGGATGQVGTANLVGGARHVHASTGVTAPATVASGFGARGAVGERFTQLVVTRTVRIGRSRVETAVSTRSCTGVAVVGFVDARVRFRTPSTTRRSGHAAGAVTVIGAKRAFGWTTRIGRAVVQTSIWAGIFIWTACGS